MSVGRAESESNEILIPLKIDVVIDLLSNYICALHRTPNLRRSALKTVKLQYVLTEKF